jgi:hypothetical protein
MKHKFSILLMMVMAGLFFITSCADPDLEPISTIDNIGKGIYPRRLSETAKIWDINNVASSSYSYEVEFVDVEKGVGAQKYDVYVALNSEAKKLVKSYAPAEFTTSKNGYKGIALTYKMADMLTLLGKTAAQLKANDRFNFTTELTGKDGVVRTSQNSAPPVVGAAFKGHFDFSMLATCPLVDRFTGAYKVEYVTSNTGAWGKFMGNTPANVTLAKVSGSETRRSFSFKWTEDKKLTLTMTLDFLCNEVAMLSITTDQGCDGSFMTITQGAKTSFTFSDDKTFNLNVNEFAKTGGCAGFSTVAHTLKFTKV